LSVLIFGGMYVPDIAPSTVQ